MGLELTDFVIIAHGVPHRVSGVLISAQSVFFEAACEKVLKENNGDSSKKIVLEGNAEAAELLLVQFLREQKYEVDDLIAHVQVFTVAHKYEVTNLRDLAKTNLSRGICKLPKETRMRQLVAVSKAIHDATTPFDEDLHELQVQQWTIPGTCHEGEEHLHDLMLQCPALGKALILDNKFWINSEG